MKKENQKMEMVNKGLNIASKAVGVGMVLTGLATKNYKLGAAGLLWLTTDGVIDIVMDTSDMINEIKKSEIAEA